MTFVQRRQSRRVPAPRPVASSQVPLTAADEQQARLRQALHRHTTRPATAQRQQAAPVLRAASLDRAEAARLENQRQSVQAQLSALPAPAEQPTRPPTRPVPARPVTPDEWVTVLRHRAEVIEGRRLDTRASGEFQALQRQVAQTLAQGFRADRGDAQARYATYGEQLATLQRHALSAPVARVVLGMVPPAERLPLQRAADEALQRFQAQEQAALNFESLQTLQRQLAELDAEATQPVLQRIQARRGGGNPLPEAVRRHLEQGLNHDLSRVRIHDDAEADKLAKGVNAIAFTTGTDIFFRSGRFDPNTRGGLELLAHEVTHTVQQSQGRVGVGIDPDAGLESEARVMGARLAQVMPSSKTLLPPVPHRDGPHALGVYTRAAALTRVQAGAADHALLTPLRALQRQPDLTLQRSVIGDRLGDLARGIPGYTPLTMAMGFDPVAGKAVKADPNVLLDALARFVPGPFKDMVKVVRDQKLLPKAWAWFQGELGKLRLGNVVTGIKAALSGLPNLVKARNLLVEATNSVRRLVLGSARKLADIALTAITAGLGPVGKKLMGNLRQSGDIVTQVLKNPGQFAANLMNALKQGFLGFVGRSGQWIRQGLGDWLSGSANIQFPPNLNVEGVLMTALSIMNLGYDALRARLVRELGPGAEGKVALLEKAGGALGQLRGNVGKAPELRVVATQLSGEVLGGIKADVTETLVKKGVQRVALMFSPAGAAVGAILTAWNTVQTVIDKGQQIMGVIMTALGSVREIAAGRVAGAARFIEQTIGKALPVVFSFAGRMLGIGNIGARLKKLVQGMRQKLGIDKLIDAVMARLKKLVGAGRTLAANSVQQGRAAASQAITALKGIITPIQKFQVGNEKHSVWVEMKGRQPVIMVASTPADAMTHLAGLRQKCIRLGVHTQPGVRTGLATAATVINQEKRRIARAVGPAGATAHLGTGAADPKKQANSVVQRVRQALITVYEALDQAQHRSALVTINGTPVTDGVLNQLILQAVHSSKAYAKLQSDTARHTREIQGQVGTGTGQNQAMAAVTVHLGPGESFEGIYKAAKELPVKFNLKVQVTVHHQPTAQATTPTMELVISNARKIFAKRIALFVTKGGSYSVKNSGGHHKPTDLMCREIQTICQSAGISERQLSQSLSVFSRTRVLSPTLQPFSHQVTALMSVLSGAESSRGVTNLASQSMVLALIGAGKMTFSEAFEGRQFTRFGGGAYPFSMQSGESGARVFEQRLSAILKGIPSDTAGTAPSPKATPQALEFERRTAALTRQWLVASKKQTFASQQEFVSWLSKRIG